MTFGPCTATIAVFIVVSSMLTMKFSSALTLAQWARIFTVARIDDHEEVVLIGAVDDDVVMDATVHVAAQ